MTNSNNILNRNKGIFRFVVFSFIGIFLYFIPITINEKSAIPMDHGISLLRTLLGSALPYYTLAIVVWGGLSPIITGAWRKSKVDLVFSIFKFLGVFVGIMAVFNVGPARLLEGDMIPFLFNSIVVPIGLIIPVALISLSFITNYGLLEFASVFMEPVMKPIWKTPGTSAIDAVVSFTGGYSLALLVTNDLYNKGIYNEKEAAIIATGFSTVSVAFLVVIAKTLDLMEYWNLYFFTTLVLTFVVTAITARIYPISKMREVYVTGECTIKTKAKGNLIKDSVNEGITTAANAKPLLTNIKDAFAGEGLKMATAVMSSILSVGLFGIMLATFTPIFDYVAYLFYPITYMLRIPEAMLAAKATGLGVAEMFLPALLVVDAPLVTKFIVAVMSVTSVLFFSASIPCILSTDIPLSIKDIVVIWFQRAALTLILCTPIAFLLL